jgi:hypothetical protein
MRPVGTTLLIAVVLALAGCSTAAVPSASVPSATAPSATGTAVVRGSVTAGPVCPVERPGDSACAPRPVPGATILVETAGGAEVGRATTLADGSFAIIDLPAGDYVLVPQPVEGLLGTADRVSISVPADGTPLPSPLSIQYDTGIR